MFNVRMELADLWFSLTVYVLKGILKGVMMLIANLVDLDAIRVYRIRIIAYNVSQG